MKPETEGKAELITKPVQLYRLALNEIIALDGKTLLGKCCVNRECIPTEYSACELQEKTATAFSQAAQIAREALVKAAAL